MQTTPKPRLVPYTKAELRVQFFASLGTVSTEATNLREIIRRLLLLPVAWREILDWGASIGLDRPVRKMISEILLELGIRRRKPGAGKPTPQEALLILAFATEKFGERSTEKFLRAAARAAAAARKARQPQTGLAIMPYGITQTANQAIA